jgi:hypothetical protein
MANVLAAIEATIGNRCGGVKVSRGPYVVFGKRLGYSRSGLFLVASIEVFA